MSLKNLLTKPRLESQYTPSEVMQRISKAEVLGAQDAAEAELKNAITQSRLVKNVLGFCASLAFLSAITTEDSSAKLACIPAAAFFAVLANDARRDQRGCVKSLNALRIPTANTSLRI